MGSLEDLRDNYKALKSSNADFHLKINGATYRSGIKKKAGNTIVKKQFGALKSNDLNANDLDEKYFINSNDLVYSLNKKGRWKMANELARNMTSFENEDLDVRVYETRSRLNNREDNCIAVHKSKGNKIKINSTYGNTNSIIISEKNKNKLPKVKKENDKNHIIVDLDDENDDNDNESYIQYQVEYAPKVDILKRETKFAKELKAKTSSKKSSILGDEFDRNKYRHLINENVSLHANDNEIPDDDSYAIDRNQNTLINLDDLINLYTKKIFNKRQKDFSDKQTPKVPLNDEFEKNKKIFFSRQMSNKIETIEKQMSFIGANNVPTETTEIIEVIPKLIRINESSLEIDVLKEKFGLKYCETYQVLPRIITINLSEQLSESIGNEYNIKAWLVLKENIEEERVSESKAYDLWIKSNFICSTFDFDESEVKVWNFNEIYENIIKFISKFDLSLFDKKIKEKPVHAVNSEFHMEHLPNIASLNICKDMNELKDEFLHQQQQLQHNEGSEDENEWVIDDDDDEIKKKADLDLLLKQSKCTCLLCYDDNLSISDCTVLKTCGHLVCNSCWKNYIDSRINNTFQNAGKICCPCICESELELALIICFSSDINKLDQYLTLSVERVLFVLSSYKWCPSPLCKKIIQVDLLSTPYGVVSCECGYKTCLKCNMAPHFPAKCSQIVNYYKELKENNDLMVKRGKEIAPITSVDGKRCPKCNIFMEKNGGCNQMNCTMCKSLFCWDCSNLWDKHLAINNNQHACKHKEIKDIVKIEFKSRKFFKSDLNFDSNDNNSVCYQKSVLHRKLRLQNSSFQTNISRILGTIKHTEFYDEKNSDIKLNLHEASLLQIKKRNELRTFLQKALSFLNELHFTCEHSYLLLRDTNLDKNKRNILRHVLGSLEIYVWRIEYLFENSNGMKAIDELKLTMEKGLNCLNKMSVININ